MVNNVETIAAVVPIINMGGDEYAKIGIGKSTGTKLISASGHINKPGVYEIELGLPVEEFIYSEEYCGGIKGGRKLKAVVAGGSSVPILPTELILKLANGEPRLMSYESLGDGGFITGTMLGSGGFIVIFILSLVFIITKVADNVRLAVKEQLGWRKFYTVFYKEKES